jgi:hypothetical protein
MLRAAFVRVTPRTAGCEIVAEHLGDEDEDEVSAMTTKVPWGLMMVVPRPTRPNDLASSPSDLKNRQRV